MSLSMILRKIVALVVLTVWTVIGFMLYIPLLVRQIAVYSVVLSAASLGKGNIARAQMGLDRAIQVFPSGYARIMQAMSGEHGIESEDDRLQPPLGVNFIQLLLELGWALSFWGATLWLFGLI